MENTVSHVPLKEGTCSVHRDGILREGITGTEHAGGTACAALGRGACWCTNPGPVRQRWKPEMEEAAAV